MADFKTQRRFRQSADNLFYPSVGSDYVMVIKGYEELTFAVKTHMVPTLKNDETIEYTTTHGVKTGRDGYLQTWQSIQVSFMDDMQDKVQSVIDDIRESGKNNYLEVAFFKGRKGEILDNEDAFIGIMENAMIVESEGRDVEAENSSTPTQIQVEVKGHWYPKTMGAKPETFLEAMGGLI